MRPVIIPPVRPEIIAGKLAAIRNLEHPQLYAQIQDQPRLVELLFFLQWVSGQEGGLGKFALDLIAGCPLGTPAMHDLELGGDDGFSEEQILNIIDGIPERFRSEFMDLSDVLAGPRAYPLRLTREKVMEGVRNIARQELPHRLAALCNEVSLPFSSPWYFPDLIKALILAMEQHAQAVAATFAETSVTRRIFDDLEFAIAKKQIVHIVGNPRSGKTEALAAFCRQHPGRARYVAVPCSNVEADYIEAITEALGIAFIPGGFGCSLRKTVEYVLRHSHLMLVLDEAQFLFPQKFSPTTQPPRLNWTRTEIADKKLPLAVCFTPQLYTPGLTAYLTKTGYVMDQWSGRRCTKTELPDQLSDDDLYAVARFHFAKLAHDQDCLDLIITSAITSPNYLQFIPALAARLEWIMERGGHTRFTLKLLRTALNDVMPPVASLPPAPLAKATAGIPSLGDVAPRSAPALVTTARVITLQPLTQ